MIPEMTVKITEHKVNNAIGNDPYDVEKCGKWIDARNINKV